MGIPRPPDPYALTTPPGWPEGDEDVLEDRALAFSRVSTTVGEQLEQLKRERSQLFEGVGIWRGAAASAAGSSLDGRIAALDKTTSGLIAAAKLFKDSAAATLAAKREITDRVELANKILDWIRDHNEIPDDAKTAAINQGVAAVRAENISTVARAGVQVATSEFGPSGESPTTDLSLLHGHEPKAGPAIVPAGTRYAPESAGAGIDSGMSPLAPPPDAPPMLGDKYSPAAPRVGAETTPETPGGGKFSEPSYDPKAASSGADNPPLIPRGEDQLAQGPLPGIPGMPGAPGTPATPAPPRVNTPVSPLSGGGSPAPSVPSAPTTPSAPSTINPAATASPQSQMADLQRTMAESATKAVAQAFISPAQSAPMVPAAATQPSSLPSIADASSSAPLSHTASAAGATTSGGTTTGQAPVAAPPPAGAAPAPPVPLGPPPTPTPAAPVAPAANVGPAVPPGTAAPGAGTVGAPAPVPVSAARAQREAIAAATLRRGSDPTQLAQRVAAALNVGITDMGFYWVTGLAKDGTIVVANNYGLGYIPESVKLPERVKMVTADEGIPPQVRGSWATYPILALHGWAQHHDNELRAVIATEDQFKGFDPGAPRIILRPDDIPDNGHMDGRHRLQVISPDAASKLAAIAPTALSEVLPAPPTDATPPEDRRALLWFEVFRPLLSNVPDRSQVQLQCFVTYADHAQELALHRAHTATEAVDQRAAIADWIYWQHLSVLMQDALGTRVTV